MHASLVSGSGTKYHNFGDLVASWACTQSGRDVGSRVSHYGTHNGLILAKMLLTCYFSTLLNLRIFWM